MNDPLDKKRGYRSSGLLRRSAAPAILAFLLVAGLLTASPALATGTGTIAASPCLYLRSAPSTGGQALICVPHGASVTIDCVSYGTAVAGPWGTESLWDHTSYAGRAGYVSDAWVYTGTPNPVAGQCGTAPPPSSGRAMGQTINRNLGVAGQCTWGAYEQWHQATGYYPYLSGNALSWAASARSRGWTVVADAQPRSIVVFQPGVQGASRPYGHVAWVTSVQQRADGRYITFIEMNGTAGPYRWDYRTVKDVAGMSYILAP